MQRANPFILVDIKTTIGHVFMIFNEATGKLNLLLGDAEWERQASTFHML
jgi:hypothetical protein